MPVSVNELKEIGLNLMPLKKESKLPVLPSWTHLQTEKYEGKFPDDCNVAVICGEISGKIFVLDLDNESIYNDIPDEIKDTRTVKTSKGYHLYYHYTGFPPPNKKMDDHRFRHIDIKSEGGYVLAEGSIHPDTKKPYELYVNSPIMTIQIPRLKEILGELGFNVESKSFEEISQGVEQGGRNDSTFKYACYLMREGVYGEALKMEINKLNQKHKPPLPQSDIDIILRQVMKYEGHNIPKHMKEVKQIQEQDKVTPVKMQEIRPELHEGISIQFNCSFIGVGERQTYTKQAEYMCSECGISKTIKCDDYHLLHIPRCKHGEWLPDTSTIETGYIQQVRIQEFIEESKNSSPIEFTAEILDENVGEAFISDRKTIVARFKSVPQPKGYNEIIFEIIKMKNREQTEGCMPSKEEIEKWRNDPDIFKRARDSISPEIYINPTIRESLMFVAIGGKSPNEKRNNIHVALLGDAQTGKSELLDQMHILVPGSGFADGSNATPAGLTLSMVKLYNGTSIPQAGLLAAHTGKPVIFDEIDKADKTVQNALLRSMEQETVEMAKSGMGKPGMSLPASCPMIIGGNPINGGKFNTKLANMMDNFNLSTPFISRLDIIWIIVDQNDSNVDDTIMDIITSHEQNKGNFMTIEELQRYFTYVRTLQPIIPKHFEPKIRILYKKMRQLNGPDTIPIGPRQFYGIYRLLTACAAAHLRETVELGDFVIVENMIKESYKTLKMNLETGEVTGTITKKRATKETIFLEIWSECLDEDGTVGKEEFTDKLSKHEPYNALNAPIEFKKWWDAGRIELNNETERYKMVNI